ncbi:MAG TPA: pseudouridine synthase [Albitalea sp.]|nr:pseudouridine synthase [Albitalea sp.]
MATLKLKKTPARSSTEPRADRPPLRGAGSAPRKRPTLPEAQALRAEREARYQEQLRQRFGDKPPPQFVHRDEARPPPQRPPRDESRAPQRQARPQPPRHAPPPGRNNAFEARRDAPRGPARPAPQRHDADDEHPRHPEIPGSMRLSKRMSELGIASRREADEWIAKGWVRVDDHVVSELGSRVLPGQRITVDAKAKFQQAQKVTILVNKPVGYVSGQAEDGYEPAVVLVAPQNQWREDRSGIRFLREHLRGLAPAGRLDIDSVGLLVLTQDGRIAKQLIGEDSDTEKEYLVRVQTADGAPLPQSKLALLRHGLELDGEPLRPAQVEWVNDDQLRFVLKEGKKRQIRRMCEAVGLKVLGLKRVRIGSVMLGDLPPGQWRYLRADEYFAAIGGKVPTPQQGA